MILIINGQRIHQQQLLGVRGVIQNYVDVAVSIKLIIVDLLVQQQVVKSVSDGTTRTVIEIQKTGPMLVWTTTIIAGILIGMIVHGVILQMGLSIVVYQSVKILYHQHIHHHPLVQQHLLPPALTHRYHHRCNQQFHRSQPFHCLLHKDLNARVAIQTYVDVPVLIKLTIAGTLTQQQVARSATDGMRQITIQKTIPMAALKTTTIAELLVWPMMIGIHCLLVLLHGVWFLILGMVGM